MAVGSLHISGSQERQIPWQRQYSSAPSAATHLHTKRHRLAMPLRLRLPEDCGTERFSDLGHVAITRHDSYTF